MGVRRVALGARKNVRDSAVNSFFKPQGFPDTFWSSVFAVANSLSMLDK
jgi:hypothetical protein